MRRGHILRHEVIVGVERRRFWPDEQKLSILGEVGVGGATVTDVARRHELSRQHIYQWRRQLRSKGVWPEADGTVFLALDDVGIPPAPRSSSVSGADVEIGFANGRILRCSQGMTEADILRFIRLVEAA